MTLEISPCEQKMAYIYVYTKNGKESCFVYSLKKRSSSFPKAAAAPARESNMQAERHANQKCRRRRLSSFFCATLFSFLSLSLSHSHSNYAKSGELEMNRAAAIFQKAHTAAASASNFNLAAGDPREHQHLSSSHCRSKLPGPAPYSISLALLGFIIEEMDAEIVSV